MSRTKISELPISKTRESQYDLDRLIRLLSSVPEEGGTVNRDYLEAFLCLANEIKKIKKHLGIE